MADETSQTERDVRRATLEDCAGECDAQADAIVEDAPAADMLTPVETGMLRAYREMADHLRSQRAAIVDPPVRRAAVSYVERSDGRILCVWNRRYGGWSLPGGMVEDGETVEQAQERELLEETWLETEYREPMFDGPVEPTVVATKDPRVQIQGRATRCHVFAVCARGSWGEREPGCPVTWLTREEFLRWSPFAHFYARVFAECPPRPRVDEGGEYRQVQRIDEVPPAVAMPTRDERRLRFGATTGAFGYTTVLGSTGANHHPDRCKCQGEDPTPHQHYDDAPPYACARCLWCQGYSPAVPTSAPQLSTTAIRGDASCAEPGVDGRPCGEPTMGSLRVCYDHARRCPRCVEVPDEDRFAQPMNPNDECCAACAWKEEAGAANHARTCPETTATPTSGEPRGDAS